MKANELRIGNLVYEYGIPITVTPNLILAMYQIEIADKICIDISNIPLTEEWLVKFGFEKIVNMYLWVKYIKNGIEIDCSENNFFAFWIGKKYVTIKTVHHLQNLFFCDHRRRINPATRNLQPVTLNK